jgi:hypothetical protein
MKFSEMSFRLPDNPFFEFNKTKLTFFSLQLHYKYILSIVVCQQFN